MLLKAVAELQAAEKSLKKVRPKNGTHATRHTPEGWQCETKRMEILRQAGNRVIHYGCDKREWDDAVCNALSAAPSPNDTPSHTAETTDNQESDK